MYTESSCCNGSPKQPKPPKEKKPKKEKKSKKGDPADGKEKDPKAVAAAAAKEVPKGGKPSPYQVCKRVNVIDVFIHI